MKITSLRDLFAHELKDVYSAETQIIAALPKMIKAATSSELVTALEEHLAVTEEQLRRLESLLEAMEARGYQTKKCKGMEGLLEEGRELLPETEAGVRDAAIIQTAQKVEHYEIAVYGTLVAYAEQLDDRESVRLLEQTLDEEKEADKTLSQIATQKANLKATSRRSASR